MATYRLLAAISIAVTFVLSLSGPVAAAISFDCITNNNAVDCATGEAQLSVVVSDAGSNQVTFTFSNSGPLASSITDVYFDDGTLLGIATISNGTGVDFSQGASPGNLPGGNLANPAFVATAGFTADSNPPTQPNGVNPGETLAITFNLINGQDLADTLAALDDGSLRIGIHVQGFAGGGSESFVNNGTPVPEPSTLVLLGTAVLGVGTVLRKRLM